MDNQEAQTFDVRDIVNAMSLLDKAADEGVFKGWDDMQKAIQTRLRLQRFAESVLKANEAVATAPQVEQA